jgi:hypothetical protein
MHINDVERHKEERKKWLKRMKVVKETGITLSRCRKLGQKKSNMRLRKQH